MFNNDAQKAGAASLGIGGTAPTSIINVPAQKQGALNLGIGGTAPAALFSVPSTGGSAAAAPQGLTSTAVAQQTVDPAAVAAARAAAAQAAKVRSLRGEVTNIANSIKDIFNSRYGLVDAGAQEQTGKLNQRFGTESGDISTQVEGENQKLGAAHAAGGSFDSSYRGNNQDTVTTAGNNQIRDLGTELQDNLAKIASWVATQKGGFEAEKSGMDSIVGRLGETEDVGELTSLRSQLDARIAQLRGGQAEYNTNAQNKGALEGIAPASQRTQQLKTTLSQIVAGNADPKMKTAIAGQLIQSAGLSPEDAQSLLSGVNSEIQKQAETTA